MLGEGDRSDQRARATCDGQILTLPGRCQVQTKRSGTAFKSLAFAQNPEEYSGKPLDAGSLLRVSRSAVTLGRLGGALGLVHGGVRAVEQRLQRVAGLPCRRPDRSAHGDFPARVP